MSKWENCAKLNRGITATSILGILLSTYALYVELKAEGNPNFEAFCDFSESAKCTRVLTSKYAKGFGIVPTNIPNPVFGILFYCLMIFLSTFNNKTACWMQFLLSTASVATSVYLAWLLVFVLHDFCLVCVSTYFVNLIIAYVAYNKLGAVTAISKKYE